MQRQADKIRILVSVFLGTLIIDLGIVFFLNSQPQGFHGVVPTMTKEVILTLRTAFAGLSIFLFFPLVWAMNRRRSADGSSSFTYSVVALAISECPALLGLALFLTKGAFKTFFAFLSLSAIYMLISWPRSS